MAESVDHTLVSKDAACGDKIFDNCRVDGPAGSGCADADWQASESATTMV
jgi:hypothetical protein